MPGAGTSQMEYYQETTYPNPQVISRATSDGTRFDYGWERDRKRHGRMAEWEKCMISDEEREQF